MLLAQGLDAYKAERWVEASDLLAEFCARYEKHPRHTKMLRYLGAAQLNCGQADASIASIERALEVAPDDPELLAMHAQALRLASRRREAAEAYRRCLAAGPADDLGPKAALAEILVRLGRLDEATALADEVEAGGRTHPRLDLARGLVALRTGEGCDEAIERLTHHADAADLEDDLRPGVLTATADLHDKLGHPDEAWAFYTRSNECGGHAFRPATMEAQVTSVIEHWSPGLIRRLQAWGDPSERPVLIVGTPRSGTTMTELLVGRHPRVARGGELTALGAITRSLPARLGGPFNERAAAMGEGDVRRAADEYLDALRVADPDADRVTDKMPMNLLQLGLFAAMFPNAHVIHCRRDPRDACLSCYCRNFSQNHPWSNRLDWLSAFYRQYARLMDHWRAVFAELDRPPMLETRYERVVADADGWAARLAVFVGLEGEGLSPTRQTEADAPTLRADQVGKGVYDTSVGRHERYAEHLRPLTEALADIIEAYERADDGA